MCDLATLAQVQPAAPPCARLRARPTLPTTRVLRQAQCPRDRPADLRLRQRSGPGSFEISLHVRARGHSGRCRRRWAVASTPPVCSGENIAAAAATPPEGGTARSSGGSRAAVSIATTGVARLAAATAVPARTTSLVILTAGLATASLVARATRIATVADHRRGAAPVETAAARGHVAGLAPAGCGRGAYNRTYIIAVAGAGAGAGAVAGAVARVIKTGL